MKYGYFLLDELLIKYLIIGLCKIGKQ